MRTQKKIVVEIDPEGNCEIEGKGFIGPSCANFIAEIESALGTTISTKNKKEYFQRQTTIGRNIQKTER